ncbi:MAG: 50S ribosomal protein L28 [Planctomycetes bacterium]|nr:50S ribosomal protein L28 [Planctomycetota bacterium]
MSRECSICGKRPVMGNKITRRGMAKKKGGVGKKTTGISRRQFRPNLQRIRATVDGEATRIRVCSRCIKKGLVQKPLVNVKKAAAGGVS